MTSRARWLPFTLAAGLIVSALFAPPPHRASAQRTAAPIGVFGAPLEIDVVGARSARGVVRIGLFDDARDWLRTGRELLTRVVAPRGAGLRCDFGPLAPGRYAAALMHDEDGDGQLDRDVFGIPTEGFGFSDDPPLGLAAPSFAAASFVHGQTSQIVAIRVRYGL